MIVSIIYQVREERSSTKLIMKKAIFSYSIFAALALIILSSCSKNQKSSTDKNMASLQVRLTDGPDANVREVWVDIRQIEIIMSDTSNPIILDGTHPGLYNLLDFNFAAGHARAIRDALLLVYARHCWTSCRCTLFFCCYRRS
jgi:hypothetical protein